MPNSLSKLTARAGVVFLLSGCATSSYRVLRTRGMKAEISVTADRVITECAKVSEEDDLYMFIVYALDEQNTVLTAAHGNNSDKDNCENRQRQVERVLATGKHIYLAGMGYPNEPREIDSEKHSFPKHGVFEGNGRHLQLMIVANEIGDCFGAYIGEDEKCPDGDFPITNE